MATIVYNLRISTPPAQAFAFVSDLRNLPRFYKSVHGFRLLSDRPRGEGARCAYRARLIFQDLDYESTVGGFVEGRSFALSTVAGPPQVERWSLQADERGGTHITYTLGYVVPVPSIGWLLDALFVRRHRAAQIARSMARLRDLLEREA